MKMNFNVFLLAPLLISAFMMSGCNTVKGFGQDMQKGGQELQRAAVEHS